MKEWKQEGWEEKEETRLPSPSGQQPEFYYIEKTTGKKEKKKRKWF